MDATTAKSQAAGVGAGAGTVIGALIAQAIFSAFPDLMGSPFWQAIVTAAAAGIGAVILAAWGAFQARNAMTVPQIAVAIQQGDVKPAAVVAVAEIIKPVPVIGPAGRPAPVAAKPAVKKVSRKKGK